LIPGFEVTNSETAGRIEALNGRIFDQENQAIILNRANIHETLVAVRAQFVPRITGDVQKWKFGIKLIDALQRRVFEFHAGCHDGEHTWTLYRHLNQIVPINIPADFRMEVPASIQLWLSKDQPFVSAVGIDSDGQRQVLLNCQQNRRWRLDDIKWTAAIISGWADGSKYRVDLDHAEVDWTKV
jgi:hypothetical protein